MERLSQFVYTVATAVGWVFFENFINYNTNFQPNYLLTIKNIMFLLIQIKVKSFLEIMISRILMLAGSVIALVWLDKSLSYLVVTLLIIFDMDEMMFLMMKSKKLAKLLMLMILLPNYPINLKQWLEKEVLNFLEDKSKGLDQTCLQ